MKTAARVASLAAGLAVGAISAPQAQAGEAFGTGFGGSVYVDATKFQPISDPACRLVLASAGLYFRKTCASGSAYYAPFTLPEGALITHVYTHYFDNNASASLNSELLRFDTDWSGGGTPSTVFNLGTSGFTSADSAAFQMTMSTPNITYDTYNHTTSRHSIYGVRLFLPASNDNISFRGSWVLYLRQIAPAPAAASFSDVPTSHPFFREVAQLTKSGVTLGCGGGNFCPDAPVTRGQMAAFLSRALGLHWDFNTNAP